MVKQKNLDDFVDGAADATAHFAKGPTKVLDSSDPPINDIQEMFNDLVARLPAMEGVANHIKGRKLRVATMCSGTESPLLALKMIGRAIKERYGVNFDVEHIFSCEIEPFKQAYIERNFQPPILFRDVCELGGKKATTAYGSQVAVPGHADLLVAGTSCVDYSTLNNEKQDITANGESGRTFRGMMSWVTTHRPPIVILENVCGAPWDKVCSYFDKEGYAAIHMRVDTKNYYIPHTRTRGYLFAVDRSKDKKLANSLPEKWKHGLEALKRGASSPIDAFLLPTDDPRIHRARERLVQESYGALDRGRGRIDWGRCEQRHQRARLGEELGMKRPLTQWDDGGRCHMEDWAWQDWGIAQVERVWDLMDITVLRNAINGVDPSFKTLVWNLSQNVDRQIGSSMIGICPCLTPSMIPYVTNRGGPMTGLEALGLQGLPTNELLLTRETEDNLADLAGNAMSTTVVGSSIMVALVAACQLLESGEGSMEVDEEGPADSEIESHIAGDAQLTTKPLDLSTTADFSLPHLLEHAERSARLCVCEGRDGMTSRKVQKCKDCAFTSCVKCGGRPEHNYETLSFASPRIPPAQFMKELKAVLPMCISLSGLAEAQLEAVLNDAENVKIAASLWKVWKEATLRAFEAPFHLFALKRQEDWIVDFDSPHARLELILYPAGKGKPLWSLYAKAPADLPANSRTRTLLSAPVARAFVSDSNSLLPGKGGWQLAFPFVRKFDVTVKGTGELVPSWQARIGLLGKFKDQQVWSKVVVSVPEDDAEYLDGDISGTYVLKPACGTACGALHKRDNQADVAAAQPLYFFLDPERSKDGKDDQFVFSTSIKRLDYGEARPIKAKLNVAWRQGDTEAEENVECQVYCQWTTADAVELKSTEVAGAEFASPTVSLTVDVSKAHCETATAVLSCRVPMPEDAAADEMWPRGKWAEVDIVHERAVFQSIAWLTERVRNDQNLDTWTEVHASVEGELHDCDRCAPQAPALKWIHKGNKAIAIEDIVQAGRYEQALKHRPSPFVTQLKLEDNVGMVRIGVNFASLIHRAVARLPTEGRLDQPQLGWRLTTEYSAPPVLHLPKFNLSSNRHDPMHEQPPHFILDLRDEQLRSLTWMLEQESPSSQPFIEEEISEAMLEPLGWRAEGRASRPVHVRGGVLADQVGYGKTAITLGVIDAAAELDQPKPPKSLTRGYIPVKATLIVVPPHLVRQWPSEITKFTGDHFEVVAISTLSSLNKVTITEIQNADIVVVASNLFKSDAYLSNLSAFAGVGTLPAKEGRHFNARLEETLVALREQVELLMTEGAEAVSDKIDAAKQKADAAAAELVVPSKRLKGKKYREANDGSKKRKVSDDDEDDDESTLTEEDVSDSEPKAKKRKITREESDPWKLQSSVVRRNWKKMQSPPLECFYFQRLVVDEYTYLDGKILAMVPKLKSTCRWVLSGTPPIHDFASVKTIAVFLDIHLGVADDNEGQSPEVRKRRREQTAVEKFHSFREVHSPAWHERRHEIGQTFLHQFVRQNIAEIDEIPSVEHTRPVTLPAAERAIYLELEHHLVALDMTIKKGKKTEGDREKRLAQSLGDSNSAEEALLKRCSHFDLDMDGGLAEVTKKASKSKKEAKHDESPKKTEKPKRDSAMQACDVIVKDRQQQLDDCKAELLQKIREAVDLEKQIGAVDGESTFRGWQRVCLTEGVGDSEATAIIKDLLSKAVPLTVPLAKRDSNALSFFDKGYRAPNDSGKSSSKGKDKPKAAKKKVSDENADDADEDDDKVKPVTKDDKIWDLRERTHVLRRLEKELVGRVRSLRYFTVVRDLQQQKTSLAIRCSDCPHTNGPLKISELAILSSCGHMGCYACVSAYAKREECVLHREGCRAAARELNVVRADTLGVDDKARDPTQKHYGMKLEMMIKLIKEEIPNDERVLIFVQFQDLTQKVADALEAHNIKFLQIKGSATQKSKNLERFQDPDATERVLLLNVMDESASGANLTVANHAIFLSPLLTPTKEIYEANETQAIGRLRRYGQEKTVHVWRFLTENSIDVKIFEERTGRKADLSEHTVVLSGSPKKGRSPRKGDSPTKAVSRAASQTG